VTTPAVASTTTVATPPCVKGMLTAPAGASVVAQQVEVQARLAPASGHGTCSSIGVDAEVDVIDRGASYPWAMYCTFETCTRDGVVLGNMADDPGQPYGLVLTVDGATVDSIQVTRSS
jgi:hypothetical protein